jgi:hypothetical protein
VPVSFQAHGFPRPFFFRIERNKNNRDAFVTFDQFSYELDFVHTAFHPTCF